MADDGPPPLEDMSEMVLEARTRRQAHSTFLPDDHPGLPTPEPLVEPQPVRSTSNSKQKQKAAKKKAKKKPNFGGFEGGFFDAPPPKRNQKKKQAKKTTTKTSSAPKISAHEDMPYIQPQKTSGLVLPEVQQAILDSKHDQSWMTPEFLQKLQKKPELAAGLTDPRMQQAIAQFASNPQAALHAYRDDEKVQKFLLSFMQLMGQQLTGKGDSKKEQATPSVFATPSHESPSQSSQQSTSSRPTPVPTPVDVGDGVQFGARTVPKQQLSQWLSNPQIRAALEDPETARIIAMCQQNPNAIVGYQNHPHVSLLIEYGIIAVPPHLLAPPTIDIVEVLD